MPAKYDVIVLGCGGVGSATLYHLASRGVRVLGVERFQPGHDRGSSHGHTRIIRQAYFEHPDYVPLVLRAYPLWEEISDLAGERLMELTGIIEVGPPDGDIVPAVVQCAKEHNLAVESIDRADFEDRFPGFRMGEDHQAVFEEAAGVLFVERCVAAMAAIAQSRGADLASGESVVGWDVVNDEVVVTTDKETYYGKRLVFTAGAWLNSELSRLQLPLNVVRKHLHWHKAKGYEFAAGSPTFFYDVDGFYFYGFPAFDDRGIKIGEHSGGTSVTDPLQDDRSLEETDCQRVGEFLKEFMPDVDLQPSDHAVCFYTKTPDEHFIIDQHPDFPQVTICGGLSGHGFKFTPTLGEAMADLSTEGKTSLPVEFLKLGRFASGS